MASSDGGLGDRHGMGAESNRGHHGGKGGRSLYRETDDERGRQSTDAERY